LLKPYLRNLSKRTIKSPKIYFTDTGLLSYLLKYPDSKTLSSGAISGSIFENMMVIEILKKKFNHQHLFEMYFLRDSHHNEIDLILEQVNQPVPIEFKMSKTLKTDYLKIFKPHLTNFPKSRNYTQGGHKL
jgi:uncharacterized protein